MPIKIFFFKIIRLVCLFQTWTNIRRTSKRIVAAYKSKYYKTGNNNPEVTITNFHLRVCAIFGEYGLGLSIGNIVQSKLK